MIPPEERRRMLAVELCGPRVVMRLERIGIRRLDDLAGRDPWELMHRVNAEAGRPIWQAPMAIRALTNLVEAAQCERASAGAQCGHDRTERASPGARGEHDGALPATR